MNYKILTEKSLADLEILVNEYLREGYKLVGGVGHTEVMNDAINYRGILYYQPVYIEDCIYDQLRRRLTNKD